MSVSIEDKIELFRKMIFSDIENHSAEEKERLLERLEREKDRLHSEAEAKRDRLLLEAEKKAEKESQQLISRVQARHAHQLLEKKQALLEKMIALLKLEAAAFTKSDRYFPYLSAHIQKACQALEQAGTIRFYLTDADMKAYELPLRSLIEQERKGAEYVLQGTATNIIGGFWGEDEGKSLQVDYSLRTLIEDSREMIGTELSRRLDEVIG